MLLITIQESIALGSEEGKCGTNAPAAQIYGNCSGPRPQKLRGTESTLSHAGSILLFRLTEQDNYNSQMLRRREVITQIAEKLLQHN